MPRPLAASGGAVQQVECVEALGAKPPIILLSPRGRRFTHDDAIRLASLEEFTLLCGHYKDIDQRVADHLCDGEISIGDYVLSGGDGPPRDVTEQDIIDLEREATLKLLGTTETQARIKYVLETGKPLRN